MTCRFVASSLPRAVTGRHEDHCQDDTCRGCQPCHEPHCRVCNLTHHDGTCAECLAAARADLREIGRLCDALPEEVEHRGVNGEAMMLLGPVADPEMRAYVETSYLSGRLPEGWIEANHGNDCPRLSNEACTGCAGSEMHPLTVLGTWLMVWQAELEHEDDNRITLAYAVDYLDRQLTYMGGYGEVPFEDFAGDLRRCVGHLEAVLHDQERGVRANVPCFECGSDLERRLGKAGFDDHWTCRNTRCERRTYTIAEFNFALRAALESATEEVGA